MNFSYFNRLLGSQLTYQMVGAILFCAFIGAINSWFVFYNTNDDMLIALSTYEYWHEIAKRQGRISFYLAGPLAMLPYLFEDINYLSAIRVFSWLFFVIVLSAFFSILFRRKSVFPIAMMSVSLLWTNTVGGHNMLVSYPFYFFTTASAFVIFLAMITLVIRGQLAINLIVPSMLLGFVLIIGGEIYFQYFPFVIALIYYQCFEEKIQQAKKRAVLHSVLISFLFSFVVIVLFRLVYPSQYSGNSTLSFNLTGLLQTFFVLTFGLFPGIQPFLTQKIDYFSISDIINAALVALVYMLFLLRLRTDIERKKDSNLTGRRILFIGVVFLFALVAPNFLVSLTAKYQNWVLHSTTNYLYSSFSYIVFSIGISSALIFAAHLKRLYSSLVFLVGFLVFLTQLNNISVGENQRASSARWELFSAVIKNIKTFTSIDSPKIGLSESFFDGIPQPYYWNQYATKRLGFEGEIIKGAGGNLLMSYVPSAKYGSILLVGSDKSVDFMITSQRCDVQRPCYVTGLGEDSENLIINGASTGGVRKVTLTNEWGKAEGVYFYRIQPGVPREKIISFSYFNMAQEWEKTTFVNFDRGVYDLETSNNSNWRWAKTPVELKIGSTSNEERDFEIEITPAKNMVLVMKLNGAKQRVPAKAGERQTIALRSIFPKEGLVLTIDSDEEPVQLNSKDPRLFSFAITSMRMKSTKN